jgi:hypothetical protein
MMRHLPAPSQHRRPTGPDSGSGQVSDAKNSTECGNLPSPVRRRKQPPARLS